MEILPLKIEIWTFFNIFFIKSNHYISRGKYLTISPNFPLFSIAIREESHQISYFLKDNTECLHFIIVLPCVTKYFSLNFDLNREDLTVNGHMELT